MYNQRKNFVVTPRSISGMVDNMLNNKWERYFFDDDRSTTTVPVNIKETDTAFQLDVIAPGLDKEHFNINVEKEILTISFEHKEEKEETNDKVLRNEYPFNSFKRSFNLSEQINTAGISASYTNGVLSINLPKSEPQETQKRKVDIV